MLQPMSCGSDAEPTSHLSPAVVVAAMMAAQRKGLRLREWFNRVVVEAVARGDGALSDATISLFLQTASRQPELLEGRWKLLYERIRLDDSLWSYPSQSVCDFEAGVPVKPTLDETQLRRRWPELLASSFVV